jgi:hypothetical protein
MSWLKKVGEIALKTTTIILGLGPVFKQYTDAHGDAQIDRILDKAQEMQAVIVQAEIFGAALGLSGPDKLKAASAAMAQVILTSSVMAGKKIEKPELFATGCAKIADGWADVLNSLKADVQTESLT